MQRGDNTSIPLLRARRFGEDIRTRNTRQGHFYYSLLVIVALVGLVVLGLCLFGGITSFTVREPMAEKSSFSIYLVKDDFKNGKLSSEQLGKLVGVYYSRDPEHDDLKTMFNQGIQVRVSYFQTSCYLIRL